MNQGAYAGIGSRRTPVATLEVMELAAEALAARGYIARSGHAPGADQVIEGGAGSAAEVYLPWPSFEATVEIWAEKIVDHPSKEARAIAERFHPAWHRLTTGGQALQARNSYQVLGPNLDPAEKSKFVLCWTPDGSLDGQGFDSGGTGQALRIAVAYGVPVFNLAVSEHLWRVERMIEHYKATTEPV